MLNSDRKEQSDDPELVWRFRGYGLRPGEFNTAMVHYYRAEVTRSNVWRTRLDNTTNWAVLTTGAALSFAFTSPDHHHILIPINTLLVALFAFIEARRYRYYELWSYRIHLIENDFFAAMLVPPFAPSEGWAERLAQSLRQPSFTISFWEAFGRRFRRNYQYMFGVLALSWVLKIFLHPTPLTNLEEFVRRASLGAIPGELILLTGGLVNGLFFAMGWLTVNLKEASGEVLNRGN